MDKMNSEKSLTAIEGTVCGGTKPEVVELGATYYGTHIVQVDCRCSVTVLYENEVQLFADFVSGVLQKQF